MSTNIRKQLGPAKKRLTDRIKEAQAVIDEEDIRKLDTVRTKLTANIKTYETLVEKLNAVVATSPEEKEIIEAELEECTELIMDANETFEILNANVAKGEGTGEKDKEMLMKMQREKTNWEIEKLKVETDFIRMETEKLRYHEEKANINTIKLPKMPLIRFGGEIMEWPTFWDSYSSTIHNNKNLSKIDKFKYLLSCLDGDAKDTLKGFTLSEAQYDAAVQQLKDRYDDEEFIIHSHYEALSQLPRCRNATDELRQTFNFLETKIRSLESLGENTENKQVVALIKSKLPPEFNLKLEEIRDAEWTVAILRNKIQKLIVAREKSGESSNFIQDDRNSMYSAEGLLSKDVKIRCIFCDKGHWSDECQKYKTLEERKAQIKGRCFICLSSNHLFRQCKNEKQCFYCKRRKNHHSSLCPKKFKVEAEEEEEVENMEVSEEIALSVDQEVIMKTAKVKLQNPKSKKVEVGIALLDTGAKRTYITREKAKSLAINCGPARTVRLNTFGSDSPSSMQTNKTAFIIQQNNGAPKVIEARICKTITGNMVKNKIGLEKYKNIWKNLEMADDLPTRTTKLTIDVLIGNDYYDDIMKSEKIEIDKGLYLVNSTLGWMFSGRVPVDGNLEEEMSMLVEDDVNMGNAFWDLETIGIKHENESDEKQKVMEQFNRNIKMVDNRYEVPWLWKMSKFELPDNFKLAEARLKSTVNNCKQKGILTMYDDIIKKQYQDGIIEVADKSTQYLQREEVVTHYLPHHPVVNDGNSSTKLRIVYEGCSKTHPSKKSLNNCLHQGPNMIANLVGVLLRFRMNSVAFVADIQKAYLQMQLNPADRDVTRFLWLKDIEKPVSDENIQVFRFCRVIWGIVCSAFLLAATTIYHLEEYNDAVSRDIRRNIYIDNLISGSSSKEEAMIYYEKTKTIFNAASMNMCKWNSNDKQFMMKINANDRCDDTYNKVLGMIWDKENDVLSLQNSQCKNTEDEVTKRTILRDIASIFDPLGLYSPVLLKPKLLLQELWVRKIDWDMNIPEELLKKWKMMTNDLKLIGAIKVKRCVNDESSIDHEIITFTDASKDAYAAAVYLRTTNIDSSNVQLIFAKIRLAPMKSKLTMPRMELMGVLIGCRASRFVAEQLNIENLKETLFTDSRCVIEWSKSVKTLKRFVEERVKEIRAHGIQINYVKSQDNPADIATRGETVKSMEKKSLWWKGPPWLSLPVTQWPVSSYQVTKELMSEIENEEKGSKVVFEATLLSEEKITSPLEMKEERFSAHSRLIRVTSWCLRFLYNLQNDEKLKGTLSVEEIKKASNLWTLYVQRKHFDGVLNDIEDKRKNPIVSQLGVYRDEFGMLRCGGRLYNLKDHPKLLPKDDHFTKLCILRDHKRTLHSGTSQTLAEVRKEHWVIKGRSAVRKLIRQCLICIHWEGGPFKTPPFSPYPDYVLKKSYPPFTFIGIDYLGHIFVKDGDELTKNWVCLFTCLNIRAIHLELVDNMTTDNFLLCFRRFVGRRGTPTLVISDNAPQFKLGLSVVEQIWKKITNSDDIMSYMANADIKWKFITEYAPWQGGLYERLVGLTKRALRKTLEKLTVGKTELVTLLVEIEAIINSRPLTYVDDDINSGEVLTPSKFLSISGSTGCPDVENDDIPGRFSVSTLLESWKKGQKHLNNFWRMWLNGYLETLRERKSVNMKPIKGEVRRKPEVGEIVIVKDEDVPRGSWKLAKVKSLNESEVDKMHRAATLALPSGRILKRPFRYIFPLEGDINNEDDDEVEGETIDKIDDTNKGIIVSESTDDVTNDNRSPKLQRATAVIARKKIQAAMQ